MIWSNLYTKLVLLMSANIYFIKFTCGKIKKVVRIIITVWLISVQEVVSSLSCTFSRSPVILASRFFISWFSLSQVSLLKGLSILFDYPRQLKTSQMLHHAAIVGRFLHDYIKRHFTTFTTEKFNAHSYLTMRLTIATENSLFSWTLDTTGYMSLTRPYFFNSLAHLRHAHSTTVPL